MTSNDFEILDHPADAKFVAYGDDLAQAFVHAAQATFAIMTDLKDCKPEEMESFSLQAEDKESLLYDFLDQLIYLRDINARIYSDFQVEISQQKDSYKLTATIEGCSLEKIGRYTEVKAVTYNEMEVERRQGQWRIVAVLDI